MDAIYAGRAFRSVLRDLNLTPNQVWGMAAVDQQWSAALEAALTAKRRDDLKHGTNAAYVHGVSAGSVGSISGSGWAGTASSSAGMRMVGADVCLRPHHSQAPYLLAAASLAGVQLVWITPVAHNPGPLSGLVGSSPAASCPVLIDSMGTWVPSTFAYTVTTAPWSPG